MEALIKSADVNFDKVIKIYHGMNNSCRCGCNGNYAEKGTTLFTDYKKELIRLNLDLDLTMPNAWINFPVGDNAYTIYF